MNGNSNSNGLLLLYEAALFVDKNSKVLNRQANRPSIIASRKPAIRVPPSAVPVVSQRSTVIQVRPSHTAASSLIRTLPGPARPEPPVFLTPPRIEVINLATASVRRSAGAASRSSHNELEKNRRAHLRRRLDQLREHLPIAKGEAYRLTMLNVLNKAVEYIKTMELETMNSQEKIAQREKEKQALMSRRTSLHKKLKVIRRIAAQARLQQSKARAEAALMMPAPLQAPPVSAAQAAALRSRNASEVSNTSGSSEETELMQMAHSTETAMTTVGRVGGCGSPDSGYASPNSCKQLAT